MVTVCFQCQGEEFAAFKEVFTSDAGKKVMQVLLQDCVMPEAPGVPDTDMHFAAGRASVYWEIVQKVELAEKVEAKHG